MADRLDIMFVIDFFSCHCNYYSHITPRGNVSVCGFCGCCREVHLFDGHSRWRKSARENRLVEVRLLIDPLSPGRGPRRPSAVSTHPSFQCSPPLGSKDEDIVL